jgi:hypothetical protein
MKIAPLLAAAFFGVSISLVAQQPTSSDPQPNSPPPPAAEQSSPAAQPAPQAAVPNAAPAVSEMSPVNGELAGNLDSKTAKAGDSIVIKTTSAVTTTDGTQIPKGSKLVGHVAGVKASGGDNTNSQVALQFDRAELKGGQTVPIHSEIQSVAPSDSAVSEASPSATTAASASPASGSMGSSSPAAGSTTAQPSMSQQSSNAGSPASNPGTGIAAGTVVARTGNIAIRTTSIPGVLLAINAPGQQDPRMAQTSGILLGAKRDIHLDQGTNVVIGVSSAASTPGGN